MATQKAGTVLLNLKTNQIGLIYREIDNGYSFPKGHLEEGETLKQCAIRETEEETLRQNRIITEEPIYISRYTTPLGEKVENYMYISIDEGPTKKQIKDIDKEIFYWIDFDDVENKLAFDNLKELWNDIKKDVKEIFEKGMEDTDNGKVCSVE